MVEQSIKFQTKNVTIDLTFSLMTNKKLSVVSKEIIKIILCFLLEFLLQIPFVFD